MDNNNIINQDKKYISQTYARMPVAFEFGSGSVCKDFDGKEYIDFSAGIAVNTLGFCDEEWANAIANQARKLSHTSNLYYTQPASDLAQKLCEKSPELNIKKVFFGNSGAEANECAIKTARKYKNSKYNIQNPEIITLKNSFHGRTITTLSATGQDVFHKNFGPFTDGFVFAEANNFENIISNINNNTCAIMLELIQGEGGVNVLNKDFVQNIAKLCNEQDILLIIDEVQTGLGRSGTFLLSEQYNIKPDIITLAKGLGGGLPIGAILFSEKTENTLGFGEHGSTFGGNPIVCAGANIILDKLNNNMLCEITKKSDYLKQKLNNIPEIQEVFGFGLMLGASL